MCWQNFRGPGALSSGSAPSTARQGVTGRHACVHFFAGSLSQGANGAKQTSWASLGQH